MKSIKTIPRGLAIFTVLFLVILLLMGKLMDWSSGSFSHHTQAYTFSSDSRADTITVTNDFDPVGAVIYLKGELREPVRIHCQSENSPEDRIRWGDMIIPMILPKGQVDTMARMDYYGRREFKVICVPVSDTPRYGKKLHLDVSILGLQ